MRKAARAANVDEQKHVFDASIDGAVWQVLISPKNAGKEEWSVEVSCEGKVRKMTAALSERELHDHTSMAPQKPEPSCIPTDDLEPID